MCLKKFDSAATKHGLSLERLKSKTGISDAQLHSEIIEHDLQNLASCFDNVETYLDKLGLLPSQQTDVKDLAARVNTNIAMTEALKLWRQPNPYAATFHALIEILLDLSRGDVAVRVCKYIASNVPK